MHLIRFGFFFQIIRPTCQDQQQQQQLHVGLYKFLFCLLLVQFTRIYCEWMIIPLWLTCHSFPFDITDNYSWWCVDDEHDDIINRVYDDDDDDVFWPKKMNLIWVDNIFLLCCCCHPRYGFQFGRIFFYFSLFLVPFFVFMVFPLFLSFKWNLNSRWTILHFRCVCVAYNKLTFFSKHFCCLIFSNELTWWKEYFFYGFFMKRVCSLDW